MGSSYWDRMLSKRSRRPERLVPVHRGRLAQDKVGFQDVFRPVRIGSLSFYVIQKGLKGQAGQLRLRHLNCAERWEDILTETNVVETDDGEIPRHGNLFDITFVHYADGGHIVRTENSRRAQRQGQQFGECLFSSFRSVVTLHNQLSIKSHADFFRRFDERVFSGDCGLERQRAGNERDSFMTQGRKVLHGLPNSAEIVDSNVTHARTGRTYCVHEN